VLRRSTSQSWYNISAELPVPGQGGTDQPSACRDPDQLKHSEFFANCAAAQPVGMVARRAARVYV
jgi:hypothetical protein